MMKHFVDIDDFNKKELIKILNFAKKLKKNQNKYSSLFKDRSLGLLFLKQSARTRISFSIGMQKLGGNVIELDKNQIGLGERESSSDLLKVMAQYFECLMIRNDNHKQLVEFSRLNVLPIINGLSNHSHPCQILSDIFTIEENLGNIENQQVTWLGDYNNVLTSLIQSAEILKFKLNILVPKKILNSCKKKSNSKKLKYSKFFDNIDLGVKNANCVMTDAWISMGESKNTNKKKLLEKYQVNESIMKKANKDAIFMHCLPAYRNQEVTDSVMDSTQSVVWEQAKNRMYVQQSILNFLFNYEK